MTTGGYDAPYGDPYYRVAPAVGVPGGLGTRWLARLLDGIIVTVVGVVVALVSDVWSNIMVTGLFTGLLMFVYFTAFEVTSGRTPGKRLLGLSVRGAAGSAKPNLREAAVRNAFTLLTIVPFVGGLLAFVAIVVIAVTISASPTKQGKHDELAGGTQVLKG